MKHLEGEWWWEQRKSHLTLQSLWRCWGNCNDKTFLQHPHIKKGTSWDFCSCFEVCCCFWALFHFLKVVIVGVSHHTKHWALYPRHKRLKPTMTDVWDPTYMQLLFLHNSLTRNDTYTPIMHSKRTQESLGMRLRELDPAVFCRIIHSILKNCIALCRAHTVNSCNLCHAL